MIRLIVVDDDGIVREGVVANIDWEAAGCQVVGTAANGREGWDLAVRLRPDVVLTDIKMPLVDGIALADRVYRELAPTRVVILSGFEDFSYAKKAVGARVVDYVLKWQDNADILQAVLRAGAEAAQARGRGSDEKLGQLLSAEDGFRAWIAGGPVPGGRELASFLVVAAGNERPKVRALKALVYERAARLGLGCVAADFAETVTVQLRGATEDQARAFALDLDEQQRKRWGDAVKPLLALDAHPRPGSRWKESVDALGELVQTAVLAGRVGVLDREKMLEWDTSGPALVRRMKDLVDREFGRSDLSLADAAAEAHLVPTYASTLFKKVQGVGFLEYLTQARVEAAKKLLAGTDLPVGEVAFRVGFPNQRYFSGVFRKAVGTSPVGYRSETDENQRI